MSPRGSLAIKRADVPLALFFLRHVRGLTQRELAAAAGTNPASIARYESGKQRPSARTLHRLVGALGVPFSGLEDTVALIVRLRGTARL